MPDAPEARVRARAGAIGFPQALADTPAGQLSGGEKARLLLGLATFCGPHLVVLDEPTNHLDIDSRAALIAAINAYPGAVILVSHDRHLIEACADRLLLVADGRGPRLRRRSRRLPQARARRTRHERQERGPPNGKSGSRGPRADARTSAAPRRKSASSSLPCAGESPMRKQPSPSSMRRSRASMPLLPDPDCLRAIPPRPRRSPRRARSTRARSPRPRRIGSRRARSRKSAIRGQ